MNGLSSLAIPSIYRGVLGTHLTCCPLNIDILRFLAACALWEKFIPGEFARPLKPKPGEFARPDIPAGLEPLWSAQPLIFISSSMPIDPYSLLSTSFSELASSTPKLAGVMIMELSLASQSSNSYSTTLNCFYCSNFCRSRAKVWASYLAAKFISFIRIAVFSRKTCKAGISRWNCLRKVSSTFSLSSACPTLNYKGFAIKIGAVLFLNIKEVLSSFDYFDDVDRLKRTARFTLVSRQIRRFVL